MQPTDTYAVCFRAEASSSNMIDLIACSPAIPISFDPKAFDAAVGVAQSLMQWGFLIIAASVAMLVGTSYYRPRHKVVRYSYLLFLLAWFVMGWSIYCGVRVQEANTARLFRPRADPQLALDAVTDDANSQILLMEISLAIFFVWLLFFSIWWIVHTPDPPPQVCQFAAQVAITPAPPVAALPPMPRKGNQNNAP